MSKRRSRKKKKNQPEETDLEVTAREVADRLDAVREWMEGIADRSSSAFYSSELISGEQLLTLRDILGALPGVDEHVESSPSADVADDDWEDLPEA